VWSRVINSCTRISKIWSSEKENFAVHHVKWFMCHHQFACFVIDFRIQELHYISQARDERNWVPWEVRAKESWGPDHHYSLKNNTIEVHLVRGWLLLCVRTNIACSANDIWLGNVHQTHSLPFQGHHIDDLPNIPSVCPSLGSGVGYVWHCNWSACDESHLSGGVHGDSQRVHRRMDPVLRGHPWSQAGQGQVHRRRTRRRGSNLLSPTEEKAVALLVEENARPWWKHCVWCAPFLPCMQ